jgi:hypothetical protein
MLFGGFGGGGAGAAMTISPFASYANGGLRRMATGWNAPNRDSQLALISPGEAVLRESAVTAIGSENVTTLNNLGNRKVSTPFNDEAPADEKDNIVNIWLVERDAMPSLGEKDIVHIIGGDLEKKGATYQLIRQIQMGAK